MPYSDDYTYDNAPDIERSFINSNGDVVSESDAEEMEKLVDAALSAANAMLAAAWDLIDGQKLDCPRDILAGAYDLIGEWIYCASGSYNSASLDEEFGIDVEKMERGYPAIWRTREFFRAS